MSPPRFIDILAGTADILYHTQTFFVVNNILDVFYANCNSNITVNFLSVPCKIPTMWVTVG